MNDLITLNKTWNISAQFCFPQNVPLNSLSLELPVPCSLLLNVPMERSAAVENATPGKENPSNLYEGLNALSGCRQTSLLDMSRLHHTLLNILCSAWWLMMGCFGGSWGGLFTEACWLHNCGNTTGTLLIIKTFFLNGKGGYSHPPLTDCPLPKS